ncbi:MAG: hypothetical protein RLZ98_3170 [Pseudomonadota bacterium]|jgi:tripartite-type tricarboxylate transporter receptor subunit TctC
MTATNMRNLRPIVCAAALYLGLSTPILAQQSVADFYTGKTIKVIVGFGPGGGYDTYARLAARHLGRHVPGKPALVVQNMPGGGGMSAANHLFHIAPKDGTAIGALHTNISFNQVIGDKNVKYDVRRFTSMGRMSGTIDVHYASAASGVKSFAELRQREVVVAGTGPGNNSVVYPRVLNALMGTKLKILSGFKGTTAANLALERGEADMVLKPWEAIKSGNADWLRDGKINLILQYSMERAAELKNVPAVIEFAETDEQRQILQLLVGSADIGRSLTLPPDIPKARVEALQAAFMDMSKDPVMLADAKKQRLDVEPLHGQNVQKLVEQTFAIPPAIVAKLKAIVLQN